ncbi:MAG: hypothetical protein U1F76_10840 [Candidatus Competibacteraceae bacterium]
MLLDLLSSPANLLGLGLGSLALLARLAGAIEAFWLPIVLGSYGLGFQIGWLLFPRRWERLEDGAMPPRPRVLTEAERAAIERSLERVLQVVNEDHGAVFDPILKQPILQLHGQIKILLERMEASTDFIPVEAASNAKRLALDYLPNLLEGFVAIPTEFAAREHLVDGKTARELLQDNLAVLQRKVAELADDLAARDARSFLAHTRFLKDRFEGDSGFIHQAQQPSHRAGEDAGAPRRRPD